MYYILTYSIKHSESKSEFGKRNKFRMKIAFLKKTLILTLRNSLFKNYITLLFNTIILFDTYTTHKIKP